METWKDIPGYEGYYQASSEGRIKSIDRVVDHELNGPTKYRGQLLSTKISNTGYLMVGLTVKGKSKNLTVHRLVAYAFLGADPKMTVNHKNGIRTDNRINNLEYLTIGENNTHSYRELGRKGAGTAKYGKLNSNHKEVDQFDRDGNLIQSWDSMADIERQLGFRVKTISNCVTGRKKTAYGFVWKYRTAELYDIFKQQKEK